MREVAYLLDCYPNITEQFIAREIATLRTSDVRIRIFARRADRQGAAGDAEYFSHTALLREILPLLLLVLTNLRTVLSFCRWHRKDISCAYLLLTVLRAFWLIRRLNRYGIHHIHAHFLGLPTWLAYAVSRLSPTTYSLSAHAKDVVQPDLPLPTIVLSSADKLFFCTEYMRKYFLQKHPALKNKTAFMPHGLNLTDIPAITPEKTRDIIAIGRLIPKKGFLYLLQALKEITDTAPELRATIFGEGPQYAALMRYIRKNRLADNIQIRPFISPQEILREIGRSRLLVHCGVIAPAGDSDGLPNVIPEALALGVPVLANSHPALREIFTPGQQILFSDAMSAPNLALDLLQALRDEPLRRHLSECGRAWVCEHFDNRKNVQPLHEFLLSASGPGRRTLLYGLEATVGGTQKHLRLLTDALHKRYDIHLFVSPLRHTGVSADLAHYRALGVTIAEYPMQRRIALISDCKAVLELSGYLCRNRMDVQHFHSSKAGGIGRLAAWLCGYTNVLYSPHAPAFLGYRGLRRHLYILLERFLNRITRVQIAVSETEKLLLVKNKIASTDRIIVAANTLPEATYAPRVVNEIRTIGFIGRLEPQKNPRLFLQACLCYLNLNPLIRVRIAGDGKLKPILRQMTEQAALTDRVEFCGYVNDTVAFYQGIDLLVLPSLWEGNPYTLWEAIAAGVPVIASDIAVHREILGDGYPYFFRGGGAEDALRVIEKMVAELPLDTGAIYDSAVRRYFFTAQVQTLCKAYDAL